MPGGRTTGRALAVALVTYCPAMLSSCTEEAPEARSVADSAGVQIVTNLHGSLEAADVWTLSAEPFVDIGSGQDPEVPLFGVTDVTPLDGDRVAIAMNRPSTVLVFGSQGRLIGRLGQEGEGPGEFFNLRSVVHLGGDSLAAWDQERRRMSVFTVEGRFIREVDLSEIALANAPSADAPGGTTFLHPAGQGSLILFAEAVFGEQRGVKRESANSYRITTDGEATGAYGPFPGMETFLGPQGGAFVPFGARTFAVTSGHALVVGSSEVSELRFYAPDGELERIVRWPDRDRTADGVFLSRWSTLAEEWVSEQPSAQRDLFREYLEAIPKAERFPAFADLVSDSNGQIWVGVYPGPLGIQMNQRMLRVATRRWLVFDPDGVVSATVSTPAGFEPHAVREGVVWGVYRDDLEVESVRAYRILGT